MINLHKLSYMIWWLSATIRIKFITLWGYMLNKSFYVCNSNSLCKPFKSSSYSDGVLHESWIPECYKSDKNEQSIGFH